MFWQRKKHRVMDVFDQFIERRNVTNPGGKRLSPKTIYLYRHHLSSLDKQLDMYIEDMRENDMYRHINHLHESNNPCTIGITYSRLKCFFTECVGMGFIAVSPMENIVVRRPKVVTKKAYPLDWLRKKFLKACWTDTDEMLVMIMSYTGARIGEIAQMQWGNIEQMEDGSRLKVGSDDPETGTKTGARLVPLNTSFARFLKRNRNGSPYLLFSSKDHAKGMTVGYLSKRVKLMSERAGIEATAHTFRRSVITHLAREKVDSKTISKLVGTTPEIISKHYLDTNIEYQATVVEVL